MTDKQDISWDKKNFVSNFVISTGTQFFASFLSFLISYLILKKYSEHLLGELVMLISLTQVFVFLCNWSLVAVQKLGAEEFLEKGNLGSIFTARVFLLLINYATIVVLYLLLQGIIPVSFKGGLLALSYGFILVMNTHFYAGFQARKSLKLQGIMLVIEKVIIIAGLFLLIKIAGVSVNRIFIIYLGASLVVSVLCGYMSKEQISFNFDKVLIKRIARFSLPLIPYSVVAFLSTNYCDSFFLNKYVEPAQLAQYSVAYQFNGIWLQIPTILGGIVLPFFITSNKQNSATSTLDYITRYGIVMNYLWAVISFCLIIFLLLVLPLLYNGFDSAFFTCLYLFIAASCLSFSSGVFFSPFLLSNGVIKIALPLAVLSAVSNVVGNILLIPAYGIIGSALASVIFAFLFATLLTVYVSWKYRINLRDFLINNCLVMTAVLAAFFYSRLIILAGFFAIVFLLILLLNGQKIRQVFRIIVSGLKGMRYNTSVS